MKMSMFRFADDIAIIAESEQELKSSINQVNQIFQQINMDTYKKTTTVRCNNKKGNIKET